MGARVQLSTGCAVVLVVLAGCATAPQVAGPDEPPVVGEHSTFIEGTGLGWVDLRFRVPNSTAADLGFFVQVDYDSPASRHKAWFAIIAADADGRIDDPDMAEMANNAYANESQPASVGVTAGGTTVSLPSPVDAPRLTTNAPVGTSFQWGYDDLPRRCGNGNAVEPGSICHVYMVLARADAGAPFRIWVNATDTDYAITHGFTNDTFTYAMHDFEKEAGVTTAIGDARTIIGTDLRLEVDLGTPDMGVLFALRASSSNAGAFFGAPMGESWYQRPNGERQIVENGLALEVAPAGGSWVFGLDSRIGDQADHPTLWGAKIVPAKLDE